MTRFVRLWIAMTIVAVAGAAADDAPFRIPLPPGVDLQPYTQPALSPDGNWVALLVLDKRIAVLSTIDPKNARLFDGTTGARDPFWSPDGKSIAYFTERDLRELDPDSGRTRTLCSCHGDAGTWGMHGILFSGAGESRIQSWSPASRTIQKIGKMIEVREYAHQLPHFFPDGEHFLFIAASYGTSNGTSVSRASLDVYVGDLAGGQRIVAREATRAVVLDAATAIILRDRTVFTLDLSTGAERKMFGGAPVSGLDANGYGALVRVPDAQTETQLVWFDRSGRQLSTATPAGRFSRPRISPDGKRIAYYADGSRVVIQNVTGEIIRTFRASSTGVAFSPDSRRIAAPLIGDDGKCNTSIADLESGAVTPLYAECSAVFDWSPDGEFVAVETSDGRRTFFRFIRLDGSSIVRDFVPGANQGWLRFARNGRAVAFDAAPATPEGGWHADTYRVYLIDGDAINGGRAAPRLIRPATASGGADSPAASRPAWSGPADDLYVINGAHEFVRAGEDGRWRDVTLRPFTRSDIFFVDYDVAPDGQTMLVNERIDALEFSRIAPR